MATQDNSQVIWDCDVCETEQRHEQQKAPLNKEFPILKLSCSLG